MYSGRSFKDAYLEVYRNLNEASSANPYTNPTAAQTAVRKATEAPKPAPAPETPKASPAPETPKAEPSLFKSKSELEDIRKSSARATMAGPSKEAQALMSPRAKRILSGNSVYDRGSGRDDMIAGNIQRARGGSSTPSPTSTSSEKPTDGKLDMSKFKKIGPAPSSTQTPPSSSTSSRPSSLSVNISNTEIDKNRPKNRGIDRGPNRPDRPDKIRHPKGPKSPEKPENSKDEKKENEVLYPVYLRRGKGGRKIIPASITSSYEYENSNLVESHYEVGDKVSCKASGMTGKVVKVDSEEKGKYYTVKREDGKTMKYAPDELKKGNGGAPKDKEEKFHTKLDKLVHKTFGSSPEEKKQQKEETDLFDYVLDYLVSEGYADTNENALVIMANMSEEWREDIMEISLKAAIGAYANSSTGEFEGQDSPRDVERTGRLRRHIKRKFGKKAAEHADRAADAQTFGRRDASGRRKQRPEPRIQTSDHRTTQDGKMHKQDQRELKTNLMIRRDRRLRAAEDR